MQLFGALLVFLALLSPCLSRPWDGWSWSVETGGVPYVGTYTLTVDDKRLPADKDGRARARARGMSDETLRKLSDELYMKWVLNPYAEGFAASVTDDDDDGRTFAASVVAAVPKRRRGGDSAAALASHPIGVNSMSLLGLLWSILDHYQKETETGTGGPAADRYVVSAKLSKGSKPAFKFAMAVTYPPADDPSLKSRIGACLRRLSCTSNGGS